jgi:myosin-5
LSGSGCVEVENVDDAAEFKHVVKSMGVVGLSPQDQEGIFCVLAGLLHLGNVKFVANETVSDSSHLDPTSTDAVEKAAELLG